MSYVRIEYPKIQAFKSDGTLAVGYKVYTYTAGTTDAATTYSERTLTTPNANPVVLNARGEADIYTASPIKLVLKTDADATVWTVDYCAEQETTTYTGTCVTTSNVAAITGTPTASALTNNMMLLFIPDADNTDTMGATASVVAGPDDCVYSGPYTGTTSSTFRVEIDDDSADPETFKWRKDTEDYTTGVAITGDDQTLKEGISVNFAVLVGHTNGDYWTQAVTPPYKINLDSLGAKVVYKNSGGSLIPLESGDIKQDYPAIVVYSAEQACWLLINTADFTTAAEAATDRIRYDKVDDYTLKASDHGNEISFTVAANKALTLPAAANLADKFFYITAADQGYTITITADGTEKIYGMKYPDGSTTYPITGYETVQISTNGVDWHIMTESLSVVKRTVYGVSGSPHNFVYDTSTRYILVQLWSGSGGGGSHASTPGDMGGGGGGSGYSEKFIARASLSSPEVVTVGAAGTAGAIGENGGAGGTSSFGPHCSATGGGGGANSSGGGAGGAGSNGDLNFTGCPGRYGGTYDTGYGGAGRGPYHSFGGNGGLYGAVGYVGQVGGCIVTEFK